MKIKKIFIAHSWTDVGLNIQTKAVATKLSETTDIVFLSQARIGKPWIMINNHLKIKEWPSKRPNGFKDFLFLIRQIRKEKPEALIVHFGATNICMIVSWLMGVKYRIAWMHTLSSQYYLDSKNNSKARVAIFFRRQAYHFATHIIVQNEHGRKDAIENFNINQQKLYKIYNGICNTELPKMDNMLPMSIRFSGRLDKSKGIDILIKAFSKVYMHNKNIILEIAGKGSEVENINAMIKEGHLEDAVKLHGYFSNYTEAIKFISEAYCLVIPSRMDNFPTVMLEAIAHGVPVIASNVGGIPDMIEDGKEGFLIANEDIGGLASSIKKLTEDKGLRNEMSRQALKTFNEKFSMEKHVSNVIDFLDNLQMKN